MVVKYPIILSISEPNNDIGLIKIRQSDEETQVFEVTIEKNGSPFPFEGLDVFFMKRPLRSDGTDIVEDKVENVNPLEGKFEYTLPPNAWQTLGNNQAYFSFRKTMPDLSWKQAYSTRDFTYNVIKDAFSDGLLQDGSNGQYIWTFAELLRRLQEFENSGRTDFENWFNEIKDNLSEDAAGNLMMLFQSVNGELSEATEGYDTLSKKLESLNQTFNSISTTDRHLGDIRDVFVQNAKSMRLYLDNNSSKVNIAAQTDIHFGQYGVYWGPLGASATGITHIQNVAAVSDLLDFAIEVGDNTDYSSSGDKSIAIQQQRAFATSVFASLKCPCALLKGNHDDNSGYGTETNTTTTGKDYIITDADFKSIYRQNVNLFGEVRENDNNYFYYDVPNKNVRIIGLDSYQTIEDLDISTGKIKYPRQRVSAFQQDQIRFLYQALKSSDGKHVVIFTHCPLSGVFKTEDNAINHEIVLDLLSAFIGGGNGTLTSNVTDYKVDLPYSFDKSGVIAGCFYGHHHVDSKTIFRGINHVRLTNCFGSNGPISSSTYASWWWTEKEDAYRVITLDTKLRKIHTERFGDRGLSFDFDY